MADNGGFDFRDDEIVITIDDIHRTDQLNSHGVGRVAHANFSHHLGFGGTLNAYRVKGMAPKAPQKNSKNLEMSLNGCRLVIRVDPSIDLGLSGTGRSRIVAHGAETIDGDLKVQVSVWRIITQDSDGVSE